MVKSIKDLNEGDFEIVITEQSGEMCGEPNEFYSIEDAVAGMTGCEDEEDRLAITEAVNRAIIDGKPQYITLYVSYGIQGMEPDDWREHKGYYEVEVDVKLFNK